MKIVKTFGDFSKDSKLKVGIYFDSGVTDSTIETWCSFFRQFFHLDPRILDSQDFLYENFKHKDLIIIPGGSSIKQSTSMSQEGKDDLEKWVKEGGKVLAVCAGFFLLSSGIHKKSTDNHEPAKLHSLGLLPVSPCDSTGELVSQPIFTDFNFTRLGKEIFGASKDKVRLYWHGGPIILPTPEEGFKTLMTFEDEIPRANRNTKDFTKGAIAAVYVNIGRGHIIAISPHIEKTFTKSHILENAVRFLLKEK
jgi:glutamine amidotransferase-like uncharacterized protein